MRGGKARKGRGEKRGGRERTPCVSLNFHYNSPCLLYCRVRRGLPEGPCPPNLVWPVGCSLTIHTVNAGAELIYTVYVLYWRETPEGG